MPGKVLVHVADAPRPFALTSPSLYHLDVRQ